MAVNDTNFMNDDDADHTWCGNRCGELTRSYQAKCLDLTCLGADEDTEIANFCDQCDMCRACGSDPARN